MPDRPLMLLEKMHEFYAEHPERWTCSWTAGEANCLIGLLRVLHGRDARGRPFCQQALDSDVLRLLEAAWPKRLQRLLAKLKVQYEGQYTDGHAGEMALALGVTGCCPRGLRRGMATDEMSHSEAVETIERAIALRKAELDVTATEPGPERFVELDPLEDPAPQEPEPAEEPEPAAKPEREPASV